jgi:hypothetical protein
MVVSSIGCGCEIDEIAPHEFSAGGSYDESCCDENSQVGVHVD